MDSLVRMRYLFDTLQPKEQQEAIKRLTTTCGNQWVMTLIFNHFAKRLQSTSEDDDNDDDQSTISAIIRDISSVITDRQSQAETQSNNIELRIGNESEAEDQPLSIQEIPSVMISKIASYLNQYDYIDFMHSSRRILIGCHSPFSLYHLKVDNENYDKHGFRSAASLRSLTFSCNKTPVQDIMEAYPYQSNVERLTLKCTTFFDETTKNLFDCISRFPNIECMDLSFNRSYDPLIQTDFPVFPALKGIVHHLDSADNDRSKIQRSLMRKHATQIEALKLVMEEGVRVRSPDPVLCNLKELKWIYGYGEGILTRDVLFEWIKHSTKLRIFSADCSRMSFVAELIPFLIEKQPDLQFMEFRYDGSNELGFLQKIHTGLSMSKLREKGKVDIKKEFKVRIRFEEKRFRYSSMGMEKAEQILDALGHLVQILGGCNVRHYMVQMKGRLSDFVKITRAQSSEAAKSKLNSLLQKWNGEYRVDSFLGPNVKEGYEQWFITFCNKDNPMKDGFRAHGLFVE